MPLKKNYYLRCDAVSSGYTDVSDEGCGAKQSPPSNAKVKLVELYLQYPVRLHGVVLN
jgi:hypothetical protein